MLFSVNYKSKYKDQANEIKCPVNQLGLLLPFIKSNEDKRYNVIVKELTDKNKEQIDIIKSLTNNYTVECTKISDLRKLRSEEIQSYLKYPVTDWETFDNLVNMGVSDIYIDGPLCFQCDSLKHGENSPRIRVSPTVSANAAISTTDNINSFFIRPEDLEFYEPYIDIIDFNVTDQDIEDTLFKIYKRGSFSFNLPQLVDYVHFDLPNPIIPPQFAETRVNCGQKCKIPNQSCNKCALHLTLAQKILGYFKKLH